MENVYGIEIDMVSVEPSGRIYGIGIVIVQPSERTFGDHFKGERSDTSKLSL